MHVALVFAEFLGVVCLEAALAAFKSEQLASVVFGVMCPQVHECIVFDGAKGASPIGIRSI